MERENKLDKIFRFIYPLPGVWEVYYTSNIRYFINKYPFEHKQQHSFSWTHNDRTVLLDRNEPFQPIFWDMKQIMNDRSAEDLHSEILKILKNSEVAQDFQITGTNKAAEKTTKNTINFENKQRKLMKLCGEANTRN